MTYKILSLSPTGKLGSVLPTKALSFITNSKITKNILTAQTLDRKVAAAWDGLEGNALLLLEQDENTMLAIQKPGDGSAVAYSNQADGSFLLEADPTKGHLAILHLPEAPHAKEHAALFFHYAVAVLFPDVNEWRIPVEITGPAKGHEFWETLIAAHPDKTFTTDEYPAFVTPDKDSDSQTKHLVLGKQYNNGKSFWEILLQKFQPGLTTIAQHSTSELLKTIANQA